MDSVAIVELVAIAGIVATAAQWDSLVAKVSVASVDIRAIADVVDFRDTVATAVL